ncbi:MAG: ribonuclease J, partial [Cyanobacteria bacterium J06642_3]
LAEKTIVSPSLTRMCRCSLREIRVIAERVSPCEPLRSLNRLPDEKVLILSTGSQGETLSAMTRISRKEHRHIRVKEGDTIVFSANPIPGNTIAVVNTIDRLMMQGANVIYGKSYGIHVSGHGSQEDHKLMLSLTRPKFFVPVHGEHRMLVKHAGMAQAMGIPQENTVIINNGDIIELNQDSIQVSGQVQSGIALVDRAGIVQDTVMKERQQLAEDGVITVATAIDWSGRIVATPSLHLRGVVTKIEASLLQRLASRTLEKSLSDRWENFTYQEGDSTDVDWEGLRQELESSLRRLFRRELQSSPLLVFLMQKPEKPIASGRTTRRRKSSASTASVAS